MPNRIVECIPNFSEARRPEVIDSIVAAIESVEGAALLDRSSDADHNRTVVTFAGTPEAVEEAAFRGIARAAELIDLSQHTGSHPRLGATDVVPFVPIAGVGMAECVAIARRLGERVGRDLDLPVYLYEQAASIPERANLENIRRGQYEALREEIGVKPERKPDFGPLRAGPAGAVVIGARHPLIAYNVFLDNDDLAAARAIAKAVRHSSGGFRFVKALGMLVDGRAQVSMNLTDFRQTPIHRVVEAVRREAARHGAAIHHSELVGLIPQEALTDSAAWYLQLDGFSPAQVLETRLQAVRPTETEAGPSFLDRLAAATATPGGGSAAAYAGAMGAALVAMVARLTIGRKKFAGVEAQMNEILAQAERLRAELTRGVDEDAAAFEKVMAAFHLPRETPEQGTARLQAIESATLEATRLPLAAAQKAVMVLALAERVVALGSLNAISDGASAAALARAALTAALHNVRINVDGLQDRAAGEDLLTRAAALEERAGRLEAGLRQTLQERAGLAQA